MGQKTEREGNEIRCLAGDIAQWYMFIAQCIVILQ